VVAAEDASPRLIDVRQIQSECDVVDHAGAEPTSDGFIVAVQQLQDYVDLLGVAPAYGVPDERLAGGAVRVHEETQDRPIRDEGAVSIPSCGQGAVGGKRAAHPLVTCLDLEHGA